MTASPRKRHLLVLAAVWITLFVPQPAHAQLKLNVPIDDPAYDYLQLLLATTPVTDEVFTTRPLSRKQFAVVVLKANRNRENNGHPGNEPRAFALTYLKDRFRCDITALSNPKPVRRLRLFDHVRFGFMNLHAASRRFPDPRIDAVLQPFTEETEDRKLVDGANFAIESSHSLSLGSLLNLYYQGRVLAAHPRASTNAEGDLNYETLRLYALLSVGNLTLLIGQDSMVWGPGAGGSLVLSSNAAPLGSFKTLPLVKFSNNQPVRLPWIFSGLGPMRFVVFFSKLEEERRDFGRPLYVGQRLNFRPGENVSFGLSHTFILGGRNFPTSYSFWEALAEFFFIRIKQNFIFNVDVGEIRSEDNIANHLMGFDVRVRLPGLRSTEMYAEVASEDIHFNLDRSIQDNVGFRGGIFVPNLLRYGRLGMRVEGTHTPSLFYVSTAPFLSGQTFNQRILGNNLGPSGNALLLRLIYRPIRATTLALTHRFQTRGLGKNGRNLFQHSPNEKRYEVRGSVKRWFNPNLQMTLDFGYQRVWDFNHAPGVNQNNYLAGLSVTVFR